MQDHGYIRVDYTGVTVTTHKGFYEGTVDIGRTVGSRITIDSFFNFKFVVFCMLLASAPMVLFSYAASDVGAFIDQGNAVALCDQVNVEAVTITRGSSSTTMECDSVNIGETS